MTKAREAKNGANCARVPVCVPQRPITHPRIPMHASVLGVGGAQPRPDEVETRRKKEVG